MKRVSCIDVGTNTALLLIADLEPESGSIISVLNRQTIVRLGEKVDRRKRIEQEALDRLLVCMREYRSISESFRVDQIIAGGTSALRDASNCTEVVETIARETGIVIGCISGSREAELTFFGAVAGLDNLPEPFAVIDIGGGSTEISMGSFDGIEERVSMDIGSVRLTERHFGSNPPSLREFDAARQEINRTIAEIGRAHV